MRDVIDLTANDDAGSVVSSDSVDSDASMYSTSCLRDFKLTAFIALPLLTADLQEARPPTSDSLPDVLITSSGTCSEDPTWRARLKCGDTVELDDGLPYYEHRRVGNFLRIKEIITFNGVTILRGWRLRRHYLDPENFLSKHQNECHIVATQAGHVEDILIQLAYKKRHLIITNKLFPSHSFREVLAYSSQGPDGELHAHNIFCNAVLVCRWIYKIDHNKKGVAQKGVIRRIREGEADVDFRARDLDLTTARRGHSTPGQQLTCCDFFCGGGFTISAESAAGFRPLKAIDNDAHCCESVMYNFPSVDVRQQDMFEFLTSPGLSICDLSHGSCPCGYFSGANVTAHNPKFGPETPTGMNNDRNQAAMYSVDHILEKTRCRIATFEQTPGIFQDTDEIRNIEDFRKLILLITSLDYSVEWRIVKFADYGHATARKRLWINASCPGEPLPGFPQATHGPGRLPYTTVNERLDLLADVDHVQPDLSYASPKPSWNGEQLLSRIITTRGSKASHPSGLRRFSIPELAVLQGIPLDFKWCEWHTNTAIKRMIGNAVPPDGAKALFEHARKSMEAEDLKRARRIHATGLGAFESVESGTKRTPVYDLTDEVNDGMERRDGVGCT